MKRTLAIVAAAAMMMAQPLTTLAATPGDNLAPQFEIHDAGTTATVDFSNQNTTVTAAPTDAASSDAAYSTAPATDTAITDAAYTDAPATDAAPTDPAAASASPNRPSFEPDATAEIETADNVSPCESASAQGSDRTKSGSHVFAGVIAAAAVCLLGTAAYFVIKKRNRRQ